MNKNLIPILSFGALITALVVFLLWRFPNTLNSNDNIARIIWSVVLLSALAVGSSYRYSLNQVLKYGSAWIGIFLVILVVYSYRKDFEGFTGRLHSNLVPSSASINEDGSISFLRSEDGHFQIEAMANDIPIQFMLDTGATRIALTPRDAQRLGFDVDNLSYTEPVRTANGRTFSAPVRIKELKVGSIVMTDISASVCQNMSGASLLGMSFLNRLKGFKIEGDRLTLNY